MRTRAKILGGTALGVALVLSIIGALQLAGGEPRPSPVASEGGVVAEKKRPQGPGTRRVRGRATGGPRLRSGGQRPTGVVAEDAFAILEPPVPALAAPLPDEIPCGEMDCYETDPAMFHLEVHRELAREGMAALLDELELDEDESARLHAELERNLAALDDG